MCRKHKNMLQIQKTSTKAFPEDTEKCWTQVGQACCCRNLWLMKLLKSGPCIIPSCLCCGFLTAIVAVCICSAFSKCCTFLDLVLFCVFAACFCICSVFCVFATCFLYLQRVFCICSAFSKCCAFLNLLVFCLFEYVFLICCVLSFQGHRMKG